MAIGILVQVRPEIECVVSVLISSQFDHGWDTAWEGKRKNDVSILYRRFLHYLHEKVGEGHFLEWHYWLFIWFVNCRLPKTSTDWYKSLPLAALQMAIDIECLSLATAMTWTVLAYRVVLKSNQIISKKHTRMSVKESVRIWTAASLLTSSEWLRTGSTFLSDTIALLFLVKSTPALMVDNVPFELVFMMKFLLQIDN